jgi:type IV pilus assembly protein PilA
MQMILKKQLKKKKGFTLVEIIVVLIILAILAAIAVPTLIGYIDKAKQQSILSEGRAVQISLTTIGVEAYASKTDPATISAQDLVDKVNKLAGTTYVAADITGVEWSNANNSVTKFTLISGDYKVTFENGKFGDVVPKP